MHHGGPINTNPSKADDFLRRLEARGEGIALAGDDPAYFPALLRRLDIPMLEDDEIAWRAIANKHHLNMAIYEHVFFPDYHARFAKSLAQSELASHAAVWINYPRCREGDWTCTFELPTKTFIEAWEVWFGERTLMVVPDGSLVVTSWNDHNFMITTNFFIEENPRLP